MHSHIYTRKGDSGETSLVDNSRVRKDHARVQAYGTIDEANSWIGVARGAAPPDLAESLTFLQHRLFNCSSNVATPAGAQSAPPTIAQADVDFLERAIDLLEGRTGPLDRFILPAGTPCAAFLHVARTVCRRAERLLVALSATEPVDPLVARFVNRSSDFLFAAARYANTVAGRADEPWDRSFSLPMIGEKDVE